jgi:2-polyprenyl-3-methyl-5-hydroxy-6-metoxy-1,4-benzoquinol methylase
MQKTTNSQSGIYHTIDSNDVFAKGSRGLEKRAEILSQVQFSSGERVLDVGCNAGLLCEYLHDRGCKVTGVDNDPHIVVAAKILSNILGRSINYGCMDLDYVDDVGDFDTIMLFSVFHHTRNPEKNAKKITKACKRIIIETRLVENGKQPIDGSWVDTTRWSFQELNELTSYLERIFSGFKYTRNLGFADKGRYILELVKQ